MTNKVYELPPFGQTMAAQGAEGIFQYHFSNYGSNWGVPELAVLKTHPMREFIRSTTNEYFLIMPLEGVSQFEWQSGGRHTKMRIFPSYLSFQGIEDTVDYRLSEAMTYISVRIFPAMVHTVAADLYKGDPTHIHLPHIPIFTDVLLRELALTLLREAQQASASRRMYVETMGLALITQLLYHDATSNYHSTPSSESYTLSSQQVSLVTNYIKTYFYENFSLHDLARLLNLSPYYFARQFKRATGLSPHQYVTQTRIEHAKRFLLRGDMTVAEVAHAVGFTDQSQFSRVFKQLVGLPPREILREGKKHKKSSEF